jgi:hypothetical protein
MPALVAGIDVFTIFQRNKDPHGRKAAALVY